MVCIENYALCNTKIKNYDVTEILLDINVNKKTKIENFNDCRSYNYVIIKILTIRLAPLYTVK